MKLFNKILLNKIMMIIKKKNHKKNKKMTKINKSNYNFKRPKMM